MLNKYRTKMHDWFIRNAEGRAAKWWLAAIAFTESSFFPIPPDPFLIAVLLVRQKSWLTYSLLVAFFSILGGIFGYYIGYAFYEIAGAPLVEFYHLEEQFKSVTDLFNNAAFWTMFIAAFTPIPFKVFTIAAGFSKVNLFVFIISTTVGRTIRFLIDGFVMKIFGKKIGEVIFKYFNTFTIFIVVLIVVYIIFKLL